MINKIINADCFEFVKTIKSQSVDLVLTDPPYAINDSKTGMNKNRKYLRDLKGIGCGKDNNILGNGFFDELMRIAKASNIVVFGNKIQLQEMLALAALHNLNFEVLIIAKKSPAPLTNNHWLPDKEYAVHFWKSKAILNTDYFSKRTWFLVENLQDKTIPHPTPKPVPMIKSIMKNIAVAGQTVYDPFAGAGSTLIAAKSLGIDFIGNEINPKYVKLCKERLKFTQQDLI